MFTGPYGAHDNPKLAIASTTVPWLHGDMPTGAASSHSTAVVINSWRWTISLPFFPAVVAAVGALGHHSLSIFIPFIPGILASVALTVFACKLRRAPAAKFIGVTEVARQVTFAWGILLFLSISQVPTGSVSVDEIVGLLTFGIVLAVVGPAYTAFKDQ